MAQHRTVEIVDDLTGATGARTHRLRWNDHDVEIDLTDKNAADLHEVLQPYLAAGRPVSPPAAGRPQRRRQAAHGDDGHRNPKAIRAWARSHGHQVSDRGQIPQHVLDAYDATQ